MTGHNRCPQCKAFIDAAIPTDRQEKDAPRPGDLIFCIHCAEPLRFTQDMDIEQIPTAVIEGMSENTQINIQAMKESIRHVNQAMKNNNRN